MSDLSFELGLIVSIPTALAALRRSNQSPHEFLQRHKACDWGDLSQKDKSANQYAVTHKKRILSAYHTKNNEKILIMTESDRSVTIILLPEDY